MLFPWASVDHVAVEQRWAAEGAIGGGIAPLGLPVLAIHFTGNGFRLPRSIALQGELPTCLCILTDFVGGEPAEVADALNAARARYGPTGAEAPVVGDATASPVPASTLEPPAEAPSGQPYERELSQPVTTRKPLSWMMAIILWVGAVVGLAKAVDAFQHLDLGTGLAAAAVSILFAGIGLVWWIPETDRKPTPAPGEPAGSVAARKPITWRSWVVVAVVGVPSLFVSAAVLTAIGLDNPWITYGATSVLAAFLGVKKAGIHGAGRWIVAWLFILVLLVGLSYVIVVASGIRTPRG